VLAAALASILTPGQAQAQQPVTQAPLFIATGVPPGFESLLEPQLTVVDLYYGGRMLMTTLARYTPESIELLKPEQIAAQVPGLLQPEQLVKTLSQPLSTHSDRICLTQGQPLCGRLTPDTAGVIFDESRFRVTLFINPDWLEPPKPAAAQFLQPPQRDAVTIVQNLSALATGNNLGEDRHSLIGNTRIGYGGHYGFADWISTDTQDISFDQLGYTHVSRDYEITSGVFDPDASAFRSLRRDLILGARFSTSLNQRQDLNSILASPVEIFLPLRSRVDIFRDGRLLSSGFYDAGNQFIDTGRLPTGAYQIEVVITDDTGNATSQQQLFVKSTLLPPPDAPQWFVEGGEVRLRAADQVLPESVSTNILRSGYRWQQNRFLGWGVAGALTSDQMLGELSWNLFSEWLELGGEVFMSDAGGSGWGLRGTSRLGETNFSISTQRNEADDNDFVASNPYPLLPQDTWLHSIQASRRLFRNDMISASYSYSGTNPGTSTYQSSLRYMHFKNLAGGQQLTYSGEFSRANGDNRIQLSVQWQMNSSHWNNSAQVEWIDSDFDNNTQMAGTLSTRWYDRELYRDDVELGASVRVANNSTNLNLDGIHTSQWGRGTMSASFTNGDGSDSRQYLAGYDTSIVLDEQQHLAVGGPLPGESAVVVDLTGAEDVEFDVNVNGQRQFSARGGTRAPVVVNAYDEYSVSITDRGTTLASYDNQPKTSTLYVGDVNSLNFNVDKVYVIVARLITTNIVCSDKNGECYNIPTPVANNRIEGLKGIVFTDDAGFFQGEISSQTKQLQTEFEGRTCTVDVSRLQAVDGVIRASKLGCTAANAEPDNAEPDNANPGTNNKEK